MKSGCILHFLKSLKVNHLSFSVYLPGSESGTFGMRKYQLSGHKS